VGTPLTLLTIAFGPTAVAVVVLYLPRALRALSRRLRRGPDDLRPVGPPLEQIATDLRRLMAQHEVVLHAPGMAVRGRRLAALEGSISDCALDAARALELPLPPRSGREALSREQLRRLLGELAASGMLLPSHEHFGR
jgi:hypothetical protein